MRTIGGGVWVVFCLTLREIERLMAEVGSEGPGADPEVALGGAH